MAHNKFKSNYRRTLELSFLAVLILMQATFFGFRFISLEEKTIAIHNDQPEWIDIPKTKIQERPQQPKRPSQPVIVEDSELPEDQTIDPNVEFDFSMPPPAPETYAEEIVDFIAVDQKPEPIGGYAQIMKNIVYPEMARQIGLKGRTVVRIVVSKTGKVLSAEVFKSSGSQILDDAAIAALLKTTWHPAYQRDIPVNVRVSVPIDFRLR